MTQTSDGDIAGGPVWHIPVLAEPMRERLAAKTDQIHVDGTFGAGGYTRLILQDGAKVIAFDRDPTAIAAGQALVDAMQGRLTLVEGRFGDFDQHLLALGLSPGVLDGFVIDIGISSMQIDQAERGFSFRFDGPLDMRMSKQGQSAADLIRALDETALADILYHYGEERASRRIARAIVAARAEKPIETTKALADLITRVMPGRAGDIHPATRSFQALRIAVNDELNELRRALHRAEVWLKPGGRLVVVTFHSLEDRIVKQFFAARSGRGQARSRLLPGEPVPAAPSFLVEGRQPVMATAEESAANPRARSAKLRLGIRTEAPAQAEIFVPGAFA